MIVRPILFLLLLNAVPCLAQSPLLLPYTDFPKKIDGLADDWPHDAARIVEIDNEHQTDPGFNNQAAIWLAWDEQYLYGLVQITDQYLIKLRSGHNNPTLNLNDAVELYLDPLNDSHSTMDINDYQFIMDIGDDAAILKGDKHLMTDEWRAPKDLGSATIAFQFKSRPEGSINTENDQDKGWYLEFALPWAAVGIMPAKDYRLRMDMCFDDMDAVLRLDTVPEGVIIPAYTYMSWNGSRDFSFPAQWTTCQLAGAPNQVLAFGKKYGAFWLPLAAVLLLSATLYIGVLWFKIRRLKKVPVREDVSQGLIAPWIDHQPQESPGPNQALFEQLRHYILTHVHEDISPDDLARQALLSLRQLQRVFREELDCTPHQFILILKMEQAPALLRQNKHLVAETAYALGFTDPGYFSKVFRKYYGVAPRDYA